MFFNSITHRRVRSRWGALGAALSVVAAAMVPAAGLAATTELAAARPAQAAANLSCAAGAIYSLTGTGQLNRAMIAVGTSNAVVSSATSASVPVPTAAIPANLSVNGLGLSGDGSSAYAYWRYNTNSGGTGATNRFQIRAMKYTAASDSWAWLGTSFQDTGFSSGAYIGGAVSPDNGSYLVGGFTQPAGSGIGNFWFGLSSVNTRTGAVTQLGRFDTGYSNAGFNGDMAFDRAGNLFVVGAQSAAATNAVITWMIPKSTLAALSASPSGTTTIPVVKQNSGSILSTGYNGMAFDSDGTIVLANSTALYRYNPTTWTSVGTNPLITTPTTLLDSTDLASCVNPPTLSIRKNISARVAGADQFRLVQNPTGNTDANVTLSATTSGSSTGVQSAETGPAPVAAGTSYDFSESMAPGSTTTAATMARDYTTSSQCTADYGDGKGPVKLGAAGTSATGQVTIPALASLATGQLPPAIVCTLTNTPATSDLSVDKVWKVTNNGATTTYANGSQPTGLSAQLTLDRGTGAANAAWATKATGLAAGQSVKVNETTSIPTAMPGCTLTKATLTSFNGATTTTALTSAAPAALTMIGGSNTATITNEVTCQSTLTLNKQVVGGTAAPASWTLTAKTAAGATSLTGTTGKTGPVASGTELQLSESGGSPLYVQDDSRTTAETTASPLATGSWTCRAVDASGNTIAGALAARDGLNGKVTPTLGQRLDCTATNRTAFVTILKLVENVNGTGTATPSSWNLTATPSPATAGLSATSVPGSATASGTNRIQVRPGTGYVLSESGPGGYINRAVQRFTGTDPTNATQLANNANWTTVADPKAAITVAADGQAVYRFINRDAKAFVLPLTGGSGGTPYFAVGSIVVAAAVGSAWLRRRSRRSKR